MFILLVTFYVVGLIVCCINVYNLYKCYTELLERGGCLHNENSNTLNTGV